MSTAQWFFEIGQTVGISVLLLIASGDRARAVWIVRQTRRGRR